jgi:cysteine desulfurase
VAHEVAHEGGEERMLAMHSSGLVDEASFEQLVRDDVALCSVMWVNNEIGVVQDVPSLALRAKARGVVFHTDAVQAFGKVEVDARRAGFDLLSISGHKIGAPKGIGALYIRRGTPMAPLMFGGTQDRGRRPGTENVAMAVGLAHAAELAVAEREHEWVKLERMRDRLEEALLARIPDAVIHGRGSPRAPHIMSVSVPGTDSESLLMALDLRGVACSAGSACQSGSISPSHVLAAIGVAPDLASAAIRMSLGALTTDACIERVSELFPMLIAKARRTATA